MNSYHYSFSLDGFGMVGVSSRLISSEIRPVNVA
jgi:hypothetical protein